MVVVVTAFAQGSAHADKSFTLDSWATEATVNPDASMDVVEELTYEFSGGPFNFGIRSFADDNDRIDDFTVSDADGSLEVVPPDASESGDWEWKLREPTSNVVQTFTVAYRVEGAVDVGTDVGDLNWQFIGRDHPTIATADITVTVPGEVAPTDNVTTSDDDTTVLRGFAFGQPSGTVAVAPSRVQVTATDVRADTFVEVRVITPASSFDVRTVDREHLDDILHDVRGDGERSARRAGWIAAPFLALISIVGTVVTWLLHGRDPTSKEVPGEYWREPLDVAPAIAARLLSRTSTGILVSSTLADLAQRGYLTISSRKIERFGPDPTEFTFTTTDRAPDSDLHTWERDLHRLIFDGREQVTSKELTAWAKKQPKQVHERIDAIESALDDEYLAAGFNAPLNIRSHAASAKILFVVFLGGLFVAIRWHNPIGIVVIFFGVAMFLVTVVLLGNRSQYGAEAAAKAKGLRNYLRDFSRLEDAPIGHLVLWERYLVYAVALGVADDLVEGMALRVPDVVADPAFGGWYHGPLGRFDAMDSMVATSSAFVSAGRPNTSGGGGGFPGGGGGGGGGGGAGAR